MGCEDPWLRDFPTWEETVCEQMSFGKRGDLMRQDPELVGQGGIKDPWAEGEASGYSTWDWQL